MRYFLIAIIQFFNGLSIHLCPHKQRMNELYKTVVSLRTKDISMTCKKTTLSAADYFSTIRNLLYQFQLTIISGHTCKDLFWKPWQIHLITSTSCITVKFSTCYMHILIRKRTFTTLMPWCKVQMWGNNMKIQHFNIFDSQQKPMLLKCKISQIKHPKWISRTAWLNKWHSFIVSKVHLLSFIN